MTGPLNAVRVIIGQPEDVDMADVPVAGEGVDTPHPGDDAPPPDDSWVPDPEASFAPPGGDDAAADGPVSARVLTR